MAQIELSEELQVFVGEGQSRGKRIERIAEEAEAAGLVERAETVIKAYSAATPVSKPKKVTKKK